MKCVVACVLAVGANCSESADEPAQAPPPVAAATANCPTSVPTAQVEVVPTREGVDLVVTSDNSAAQKRIRALAAQQADQAPPPCPIIIHDGTLVSSTESIEGATIHIKALDRYRVKWLQEETATRFLRTP